MGTEVRELPVEFHEVTYTVGETTILRKVSLAITQGPPTLLLGPNGSGKSTLLSLAMGLIEPSRGSITWGGHRADHGHCAMVFQRPVMLRRSVAANVEYALAGREAWADRTARVDELLSLVGLDHLINRPARRLSGGEQHRLALARALARDPQVLFLDEPTASLDPASTKAVEEIISSVAELGVKIVMATHDLGQARRLAGDVVFLARGEVLEHARADGIFANPATPEAAAFLRGDLVI